MNPIICAAIFSLTFVVAFCIGHFRGWCEGYRARDEDGRDPDCYVFINEKTGER